MASFWPAKLASNRLTTRQVEPYGYDWVRQLVLVRCALPVQNGQQPPSQICMLISAEISAENWSQPAKQQPASSRY
jgi:hypothetical protein